MGRELGLKNVHHRGGEDFFEKVLEKKFLKEKVDVIWDNPPYTSPETKRKVLEGLKATKKPFCMLLPLGVMHAVFVREMLDMSKVQIIIPRKVLVRKKNQTETLPFRLLVWFCYDMNLERDIYFID